MIYNEIEIEPLENILEKLHRYRGGEMMLIHCSPKIGKDPQLKCFSVINKDNSLILKAMPLLIRDLIRQYDQDV